MKVFFMLVTLLVTTAFAQAGQTITCTVGQSSNLGFSVTDANGNAVPWGDFAISASFSDGTVAKYNAAGGTNAANVQCLKIGTTTVTWTFTGGSSAGYSGSEIVGPDTVTVVAIPLASASVSYATPK